VLLSLCYNGTTEFASYHCGWHEWEDDNRVGTPMTSEAIFNEVDVKVQAYMQHPYLLSAGVRQTVSRFHFDAAYAILQAAEVPVKTAKRILEALLLLQQGLSIHDTVDELPSLIRQLHVLAGDYNSSRYYWVLARLGDEPLLDELCRGVVTMNEAKMNLHNFETSLTTEAYMNLRLSVEGELLFALERRYLNCERSSGHIRSLVKAVVLEKDLKSRAIPKLFTLRQACDWFSDTIERLIGLQPNQIVEPVTSFVLDYLIPMKQNLEHKFAVEGNHSW